MADSKKLADTDKEYKGPGRFVATVGRGIAESVAGNIIGVIIGGLIGVVAGRSSTGARLGVGLGSLAGLLHGGYKCYSNAVAGKEQVNRLTSEVEKTAGELEQQKNFVQMVSDQSAAQKANPQADNCKEHCR